MNNLLLALLGAVIGVISSITGLAGAILYVPCLLMFGITDNFKTAVGTSIFIFLPPTTLLAVYEYYKQGHVMIKEGVILMITAFIFFFVGAYLARFIDERYLQLSAGCLGLLASLYFIVNGIHKLNN